MKLLIRNLARNTTEAELLSIFQAHGAVQSCNLVMDEKTKESKGFAFIEMPDEKEAKLALANLHETKVANNKIRVKIAQ